MRPTIVVSIPQVWGVRNVLRSGLYERLLRRFRVVLAVPEEGETGLLGEGIPRRDLFVLPRVSAGRAERWALRLVKAAHLRRKRTVSDAILGSWATRMENKRSRALGSTLRTLSGALSPDSVMRALEAAERRAFLREVPREVTRFLDGERPTLGLSTTFFLGLEWTLFRAMQARGILTATQILSFDNLTSRGWQPLAPFDRFYVWQRRMAAELVDLFDVDVRRIRVTGTPQFDFHVRPEGRASREETLRSLGLDPDRRYLVHCANHKDLTPTEPALVASILERLADDPVLSAHRWVLRLHPLDDYARWDPLLARFQDVQVSLPWRQAPGSAVWGLPTHEELFGLGNLLRHADAVVNMASTTTLDAAVVDTPVVCLGFHDGADAMEAAFYREAHFSHHFRRIVESGAAPLATDMSTLRALLTEAVQKPGERRDARRRLVAELCGPVDGRAAARIADDLALTVGLPLEEETAGATEGARKREPVEAVS